MGSGVPRDWAGCCHTAWYILLRILSPTIVQDVLLPSGAVSGFLKSYMDAQRAPEFGTAGDPEKWQLYSEASVLSFALLANASLPLHLPNISSQ